MVASKSDIKDFIKRCEYCQRENNYYPKRAPIHLWWEVSISFERIHIDFASPNNGQNYLMVVNDFSTWPEIYSMNMIPFLATVKNFGNYFAIFGIPEVVVSDNARQFLSEEIKPFLIETMSSTFEHFHFTLQSTEWPKHLFNASIDVRHDQIM
ncbi:hypothetical protein RF11_04363 [Thelohanellus kitauei]|uniref:Integrase catalytic domain-containing protein n=1 Tax=Thelohanellus kitauei TaxID=669202 RepID=A0A0C2JT14_THEKT|nr:hypothetical protein RF11_04363 [Thelohanellus kitauei]